MECMDSQELGYPMINFFPDDDDQMRDYCSLIALWSYVHFGMKDKPYTCISKEGTNFIEFTCRMDEKNVLQINLVGTPLIIQHALELLKRMKVFNRGRTE